MYFLIYTVIAKSTIFFVIAAKLIISSVGYFLTF